MRLRSGEKHHLRKSADRKAQIRKAFVPLPGLICAFQPADFLRWCLSPERNLAHNEPFSTAERSERVENFLFRATREYMEAGIAQAIVAMRRLGANSPEPRKRGVRE